MTKFVIGLQGRLLTTKTADNITKDFSKLEELLNKKSKLQLIAKINTNNTTKVIQKQLDQIGKNLKLTIGDTDLRQLSQQLTQATKVLNQTNGIEKNTQAIKKDTQAIQENIKATEKLKLVRTITNKTVDKIGNETQTSYTDVYANANNSKIKREYHIGDNELPQLVSYTDNFKAEEKQLNKNIATITKYNSQLDNLLTKYKDTNTSKPIQNTEHLDTLSSKIGEIRTQVENLKSADSSTFTTMEAEIKANISKVEALATTFRNAESVADQLRAKPFEVVKQEHINKLSEFQTKVNNSGVSIKQMGSSYADLSDKLNSATNKNQLLDYVDQLEVAKSKYRSLKAEVTAQKQAERKELQETKKTQQDLNKLQKTSQQLANLTQDKSVFKNRIKQWLNENTKASDTLCLKMKEIHEQVDNADRATLTNLKKQFQAVNKEAIATNRSGKDWITIVKDNIGKFASWYGIGNVVAGGVSSVRNAIDDLKEVDTTLTEISKTSDFTDEKIQQIGKDSFDIASKYGQKATDYLAGVKEMARAGYENPEQMAELSTLAQSAGDMSADLANQYLIATDKAYNLNGEVEKLNTVLDSQNMVTNRNALSLSDLAEATKIAGSTSAQAGISIKDTTGVLGTMIAVTQQGGEISARAWKGILANLRQVKTSAEDIGDGGEDITAESLSKYEKACADLGVSLKEVKNGTVQLRDPMKILKELSEAVSKESSNSIKAANLINSVGGKYRGENKSDCLFVQKCA